MHAMTDTTITLLAYDPRWPEPAARVRAAASTPARQNPGRWLGRRRRDRDLAAPAEHDDLGRGALARLDGVVEAVEQVGDHPLDRARIGPMGGRIEIDRAAMPHLE